MKIKFIGGVRTVTGSCFHLSEGNLQILVDCGMYQGHNEYNLNERPFDFKPKEIDYLFLTHAHIDHSGLIPKLIKDGFKGKIIMTPATKDLTELMLYDSAHIQKKDAEWLTKRSFHLGEDKTFNPVYTIDDVKNAVNLFTQTQYNKIEHPNNILKYRFLCAGHILGSATIELWIRTGMSEKKIVFSGDIGKKYSPIINDPQPVKDADIVIIESTYGNRLHKGISDSINELTDAIKNTFKDGGNVLIPTFAVGRAQDLMYVFNKLVKNGQLPQIDVYLDSPLAEKATNIYLFHPESYDEDTIKLLDHNKTLPLRLHFVHSVEESQRLNEIKSKAVILAGGGMCEGGRIQHHLKHNLWRSNCSVIFVGFQAKGTLGKKIIDGYKKVHILDKEIDVRAKIYTIGGFSAHADKKELLEWLGFISNNPKVFVVHGEENVSIEFANSIREKLGFETFVPLRYQEFEI